MENGEACRLCVGLHFIQPNLRALIASGADVNAVGDMGQTPLHIAVSQGDEPIIESLLRAGARADIRSDFGKTALESAMDKGGTIRQLVRRTKE